MCMCDFIPVGGGRAVGLNLVVAISSLVDPGDVDGGPHLSFKLN